jgi:hypothetical protein
VTTEIGVLCSTRPNRPFPDAILLLADSAHSADADSSEGVQKLFIYPEQKLYCGCVGRVEKSGDLLAAIEREFQELAPRNDAAFTGGLNRAVYGHRAQHFCYDVLTNYLFDPENIPSDQQENVLHDWRRYDVGVHVLAAAFDERDEAHLYVLARIESLEGWVHRAVFPGFATIGLGAYSANDWLHCRRQTPSRSVRQSAYHAYEARRLTKRTPVVNANLELLLATQNERFHLTAETPELKGCPVSLPELEEMYGKYGPRDTTGDLGYPKSLNAVA